MRAIEVKDLSKKYFYSEKKPGLKGTIGALFKSKKKERIAVNKFSFAVEEGEFIGLIGPNGAGKTTLIKMLTGIIQPTSGTASVLGYNPSRLKDEYKKQYSLVMGQKSQLWWDLPAIESFTLNKELYEIPNEQFNKKISYLSNLFGVEQLLNVQVRRLSLGERMKMELISCLLHEPKILFLDEPTIGLDVIAQKQIRQFLIEVNQKLNVTILLTSHYMEDIKYLCKRVIVINNGLNIYDGALSDLLDKFKEYKTLTVSFSRSTDFMVEQHVEFIEKGQYKIIIKTRKEDVFPLIKEIFEKYEVDDLSIEEEEIGNIIEKIYSLGKGVDNE